MNYEDMSDFEINKAVVLAINPNAIKEAEGLKSQCEVQMGILPSGSSTVTGVSPEIKYPNYCNNPSDAWPVIVESKISVSPQCTGDDFWSASHIDTSVVSWSNTQSQFFTRDKNPLRASMICFLKMKDAEK